MIQLSRRTIIIALVAFVAFAGLATASFVRTFTGTAEASHRFKDIATGTFFHDSTAWLAENGIADGYSDGTFRPNGSITRGQASYWFANYNNRIGLAAQPTDPAPDSAFTQQVACGGERAVAGGGQTDATDMYITDSYPGGAQGEVWTVRWETEDDRVVDPGNITVWALCVPPGLGPQ